MTTSYNKLYSLPEISFIAGSDKTLNFTAYAENGVDLLDISGGSVTWLLCPFGHFEQPVLSKAGEITGTHTFKVTLTYADTIYLPATKYVQQPVITDFSGNIFRPAQGTVIISSAIGANVGAVVWNGQITKGEPGIQGATGTFGSQGTTGIQGITGLAGAYAAQGVTGVQGQTGIQGNTGLQGLTGAGIQGATGMGATGLQGSTGLQGVIGSMGIQGVTGFQGVTGIQGITGASIQGTTGATGIQGITGIPGTAVNQGMTGATGPQGIMGLQGITGIPGTAASQGATGLGGIQGATGIQGLTGLQGITGISNVAGPTGIQGITGIRGVTGAGIQGVTGLNGIQGITGIRGATGAGLQGVTGLKGVTGALGNPLYLNLVGARAFLSTTLGTTVSGTKTQVHLNATSYDTNSNFSSYVYTVSMSGYYQINAQTSYIAISDDSAVATLIYVNGVEKLASVQVTNGNNGENIVSCGINDSIYLSSGQTVSLYYYQDDSTSVDLMGDANGEYTYLSIHLINEGGLSKIPQDGWIGVTDTWVYDSDNSLITSSATIYPLGTKIKLTNDGDTKYFYVTGYGDGGDGNQVIFLEGGDDYILVNSPISNIYYSPVLTPTDFPGWFNHTFTITSSVGDITAYTINNAYFNITGEIYTFKADIDIINNGTGSGSILFNPWVPSTIGLYSNNGYGFWSGSSTMALTINSDEILDCVGGYPASSGCILSFTITGKLMNYYDD